MQATYSLGIWNNHQTSNPQTYLTSTATGAPTFAGIAGFASNRYTWDQTHLSNAVSLKSDTKGVFDFDLSASSYNYLQDILLNPFTVTPTGVGYSQNGKVTRNDGTNWQNADAKGIWRPFGVDGPHEVSFGVHGDRYRLENPVYAVVGLVRDVLDRHRPALLRPESAKPVPARCGCRTPGRSFPNLKLTLGGRLETWRALDGFNINHDGANTGAGVPITVDACAEQSARTQLDEFLAQGVALVRSEQGVEHHREFRRGLSLSDRHRALPERHGRRRRDLRQSAF